jgi:hypothetical protein
MTKVERAHSIVASILFLTCDQYLCDFELATAVVITFVIQFKM